MRLFLLWLALQGQPNLPPELLRDADLDPIMRPIVRAINQSGWAWTTESCEGHIGGHPLMVGVVTDQIGRFVDLLATVQAERFAEASASRRESQDPHGLTLRVMFWQRPRVALGAVQVRLVVPEPEQWPVARRILWDVAHRMRG